MAIEAWKEIHDVWCSAVCRLAPRPCLMLRLLRSPFLPSGKGYQNKRGSNRMAVNLAEVALALSSGKTSYGSSVDR